MRVRFSEIFEEAAAGITQRPGRSVLTALGTVLGTAAFLAVVGVTATANGQIAGTFNRLAATTATVTSGSETGRAVAFPADAEVRLRRLPGLLSAGIATDLASPGSVSRYPPGSPLPAQDAEVISISDGYWRSAGLHISRGRTFTGFVSQTRVAVISAPLAAALGLDVALRPSLYVQGVRVSVIGVFDRASRADLPDATVLLPATAAAGLIPVRGTEPPTILLHVRIGAAAVVAAQVPVALDPYQPERFTVHTGVDPTVLKDRISDSLTRLFLALALVCLVIGAFGIANTSLISVLERTPEIGLRRALGALPSQIAGQFLIESAILGGVGGAIGSLVGIGVTLGVAAANAWTPLLSPAVAVGAPVLGLVVGLLAGLYPAIRAARIEPVAALNR